MVSFSVGEGGSMPALRGDLEGAHVGFAAIGLISRHLGEALVMNLEELRVRQIKFLSRLIVGHVLLKSVRDERKAAGLGASGVDDSDPVGVWLPVEWASVVVDAIGKKLQS